MMQHIDVFRLFEFSWLQPHGVPIIGLLELAFINHSPGHLVDTFKLKKAAEAINMLTFSSSSDAIDATWDLCGRDVQSKPQQMHFLTHSTQTQTQLASPPQASLPYRTICPASKQPQLGFVWIQAENNELLSDLARWVGHWSGQKINNEDLINDLGEKLILGDRVLSEQVTTVGLNSCRRGGISYQGVRTSQLKDLDHLVFRGSWE